MMEFRLQNQLSRLDQTFRRTRRWRELMWCWAAASALGIALLAIQAFTGWHSWISSLIPLVGGAIAAGVVLRRRKEQPNDFRALIAAVEQEHPELRHLLSAAAEQEPQPESGAFRFLQLRVIDEVVAHPRRAVWGQSLERKLSAARNAHAPVFLAFCCIALLLVLGSIRGRPLFGNRRAKAIAVTPGDVQVERGTGLVISARFGGKLPAEASLVVVSASGKTNRLALARQLADPVFGASLAEVGEDALYHIEFGNATTRDYRISVFEFPALVRADAALQYPAYTGLTNRTIRDTRRISAVEGTRLTYTMQLNKPVRAARLAGSERSLSLTLQSNAVALLADFPLTNSARYLLELVDAEGRTNKFPADFSLQALPDRRPELKLAFPRGDPQVSRLEELQLQAEATDDFGVLKYGVGFGVAGHELRFVEVGGPVRANEKRPFGYLIPLESLGVEVDQVVSYFAWADDYGPDGKARRTFSDMFFAEVRPFEQIFRPDQSGMAGGQNGGQNGGQQGNPGGALAQLQKEIVIATWKLQQAKAGDANLPSP